MYLYKLAYRHDNGEVEGFVGESFVSSEAAHYIATTKAFNKATAIGTKFDNTRIIETKVGLTDEEVATIESDWKMGA